MKKQIFLFALLALFATFVAAQDKEPEYEYGRPSELKGLTKLFIDTHADTQNYDRLVKEIKATSALKDLKIVETAEEAEIIILYKGDIERVLTPPTASLALIQGQALVFVVKGLNKPRLVMRYGNVQESAWEQKPSTKFIKEFAKTYKTANK